MKRWTGMTILGTALMSLAALPANAQRDWDDWYGGNVDVRVEVKRGEGSVFAPGEPVRIEFKTNESAYHLVYGIDTDGNVRLLFPRYWEDDGWVKAGRKVRLRAEDLAWPADRWGSDGVVYVEAIASPTPFDFHGAGLVREAGSCGWYDGYDTLRINGDPFLGFNDVHQRLFPDWDNAVFAVDYTHFYVGQRYEAPRYLGYRYRRVYVSPPHSGFQIGIRFGWSWEFGYGHCRPVYARYYVPGVHYVHHRVHSHHHVAYRHHHGRYADYGHYGYRDGWNGSRYRVVHDTRHRKRVTRPPDRKRHRSVMNLRESLERKRVKRTDAARAPQAGRERRRTDVVQDRQRVKRTDVARAPRAGRERQRADVVQNRQRAERGAAAARKRLSAQRSTKRQAPARVQRETVRRAPEQAERRDVKRRIRNDSKSASRATAQQRRKESSSRSSEVKRPQRAKHTAKRQTLSTKKLAVERQTSAVKPKGKSQKQEAGAKRAKSKKSATTARAKKKARR